jgi:hypothetical protein
MDVINLADKFRQLTEAWSPKIVGDINDIQVKLVKLRGEFIIVPYGTEHCPVTLTDEVNLVLLEPRGTLNTGNVTNERTVAEPGRIREAEQTEASGLARRRVLCGDVACRLELDERLVAGPSRLKPARYANGGA